MNARSNALSERPSAPPGDAARLIESLTAACVELEAQVAAHRLAGAASETTQRSYVELFRDLPVPAFVLHVDGSIAESNRAARALVDDLVELRHLADLGLDPRLLASALRALPADAPVETEWTLLLRSGPVASRVRIAPRPGAREWLVVLQDVTALRAVARTQQTLANRFRALVQSSRDGILVFHTRSWMVLESNPAFAALVGVRRAPVGQQLLSLVKPEQRGAAELQFRRALTISTGPFRVVFQAGGAAVDTEAVLSPLEGESTAMLVVRDDRARRLLDEERAALQERAMHAQKLEALGRLAAGVAHELNNALAVISSTVQSLEGSERPDAESLLALRTAVERASQTTTTLLAHGRAPGAHRARVELRELVERDVALLRRAMPRSVSLEAALPPEPVWVLGDEAALHQALMNLVLNARDAVGPTGTVRVVLRTSPSARAELVVRDDGPGIPPALRERVFEPFFTTKEQGKGTGLGLSLVWSVARSHEGEAWVGEAPGGGAEVGMRLPQEPAAPIPEEPPPGVAAPRDLRGCRVLLVDDEAAVLRSHHRLLTRVGAEVLDAASVGEALPLLSGVDAVVCDYQLGRESGLDLLRALRVAAPRTPFVLVTGYLDEAGEQVLRADPLAAYLPKPFLARQVTEAIAALRRAEP